MNPTAEVIGVIRRTGAAASVAVLLMVCLAACSFGGPDLSDRAAEIESELDALPGVKSVRTTYQNGFSQGRVLEFTVFLKDGADAARMVAVAEAFNREVGDEFDDYSQRLELRDGNDRISMRADIDTTVLASQLARLAAMQRVVPTRNAHLSLRFDEDPPAVLDLGSDEATGSQLVSAATTAFGTHVGMVTATGSDDVDWTVWPPYPNDLQRRVNAAVEPHLSSIAAVSISGETVHSVIVNADEADAPEASLARTIAGISTSFPSGWEFRFSGDPAAVQKDGRRFTGLVRVGTCDYDESDDRTYAAEGLTSEAFAIQTHLRDQFDACS